MKFSPRNAAELRNVLLLIADYHDSRIEANFKIGYDIGAEESATRSEWCRCIADDVGFCHEVADDDLSTLANELRGQMERSQTFNTEDVAEIMGHDGSWELSNDQFQLHIKLVEFCRLLGRACMNGLNAAKGPTDSCLEPICIPMIHQFEFSSLPASPKKSFASVSREVFDCREAAARKMTLEDQIRQWNA